MRRFRVLMSALLIAASTSGCTLYGWGTNDRGQIGDGSRLSRDEPVPAVVNPGWSTIDAGPAHTCATDASRRLFCWGSGSQGQLGFGDTFPFAQATPRQVGTATDWASVSAGGFSGGLPPEFEDPLGSSCGIRAPGGLYCWGVGAIGSARRSPPVRHKSAARRIGPRSASAGSTHVAFEPARCTAGDGTRSVSSATARRQITANPCGSEPRRTGGGECQPDRAHLWHSRRRAVLLGEQLDGSARRRHDDQPRRADSRRDAGRLEVGERGRLRRHQSSAEQVPGSHVRHSGRASSSIAGVRTGKDSSGSGRRHRRTSPLVRRPRRRGYSVSAGGVHTCAIQVGNDLFCWGSHQFDDPFRDPDGDPTVPQPWAFGGWASVSSGGNHTVVLRATDDSI